MPNLSLPTLKICGDYVSIYCIFTLSLPTNTDNNGHKNTNQRSRGAVGAVDRNPQSESRRNGGSRPVAGMDDGTRHGASARRQQPVVYRPRI